MPGRARRTAARHSKLFTPLRVFTAVPAAPRPPVLQGLPSDPPASSRAAPRHGLTPSPYSFLFKIAPRVIARPRAHRPIGRYPMKKTMILAFA